MNGSEIIQLVIPNSVTSIGDWAFSGCSALTSITIGNSVTSIGNEAFCDCSGLTSVTITNSVTSIGDYAFEYCSGMTSVTIGNSVKSIGAGAFSGCSGLTSVHITDIESWCKISFSDGGSNPLHYVHHLYMNGSEITQLVIPNSVTSIGSWAFQDCSGLTSITIPNSVTSIGGYAFGGCSGLTSVTIPNSVTSIRAGAFSGCSGLTSVSIPNSVTSIEGSTFSGCKGLTSVTIPNSVTSIGNYAFSGCSGLTSVTIPNSVTSIGDDSFNYCTGLTSVTIGSGVQTIGYYAFASCAVLAEVYCYAENVPSTDYDAFSNSNIDIATLHVPSVSVTSYAQTAPWSGFKSVVAAPIKCATPTIKYSNDEISFECETEGVEFVSHLSLPSPDNTTNKITAPSFYTVTVYAKKEGYMNSDIATADIDVRGIQGDTNRDGKVTISDAVGVVNIILNNGEPQAAPALEEPAESMEAE